MPSGRRKVIETWMLVAPDHVTMAHTWNDGLPKTASLKKYLLNSLPDFKSTQR